MSLILLVDDLPELLELYTDIFEMLGHRVMTAADGVEALALARARPPDLVITDWMLPRMDGCELCRRLREEPELRQTPILLHSSLRDPCVAGETGFLPKPCELNELEACVSGLLSQPRPARMEVA